MNNMAAQARFRAAVDASAEDWIQMEEAERHWHLDAGVGLGLLRLLGSMEFDPALGAPVILYTHSLQTDARALEDGADDELVVVALFHDVPEAIG